MATKIQAPKAATEAKFLELPTEKEYKYIFGDNSTEAERLVCLHDATVSAMDDKLVLAPVDLKRPGVSVVDSACCNGHWLRALDKDVGNPSMQLTGVDIGDHFFPEDRGKIRFIQHSLANPWPAGLHDSFDFVNQRYAISFVPLAGATMQFAIDELYKVTKPGGWIQLVEGDMLPCPGQNPGERLMSELMTELMAQIKSVPDYGRRAFPMLKAAGCVDVCERIIHVRFGANSRTDATKHAFQMTVDSCVERMKGKDNPKYSDKDLDEVPGIMARQMDTTGVTFASRVVWGRKPE